MHIHIDVVLKTLLETVPLEHLGDGLFARQMHNFHRGHLFKPLAVVADFKLLLRGIEDLAGLGEIRPGVGLDLVGA